MGPRRLRAIALTIFFSAWTAVSIGVIYLASVAGYSFGVGAALACLLFFSVNSYIGYRFRVWQAKQQGGEPPSLRTYLFPKPVGFSEPISVPRLFRVVLGLIVFVGGLFLMLASTVILSTQDASKFPYPIAGVVGLIALGCIGAGSLYVGIRLMTMKDSEPVFKALKRNDTTSSNTAA